jgi:superfamily I DNA and/or RNA helicase
VSVRVATIDNFQGEESRIVIASLVRSNEEGNIGFLSGRERVTVLLSRARDGLILLGNSDTLRNAKNKRGAALWGGVLDSLGERGLFKSFPAVCQFHGNAPSQLLDSAEAFHK